MARFTQNAANSPTRVRIVTLARVWAYRGRGEAGYEGMRRADSEEGGGVGAEVLPALGQVALPTVCVCVCVCVCVRACVRAFARACVYESARAYECA